MHMVKDDGPPGMSDHHHNLNFKILSEMMVTHTWGVGWGSIIFHQVHVESKL